MQKTFSSEMLHQHFFFLSYLKKQNFFFFSFFFILFADKIKFLKIPISPPFTPRPKTSAYLPFRLRILWLGFLASEM